ncbi:MAG: DUF6476 family protein [Devosia sp.]
MNDPEKSDNTAFADEKALSPEATAAIGKARRSAGFAMGIMLLGFMAVGFAIVYRVMRDAPPPTIAATVSVPVGSEVVSALTVDGTIQVTYRAGGAVMLSVFDAKTGELRQTTEIAAQ